MDRRKFLKTVAGTAAGGLIINPVSLIARSVQYADLVLIRDGDPALMTRKALELLGGMQRFIKPGQTVVIKPNMSWDRAPEYAANTNPEVAAEVVRLCYEAGAKKVLSFDRTCNEARRCYINSGLEKAMSEAGAEVRFIREQLFEKVNIENYYKLKEWDFYRDALEADVFINIPILKHHSLAGLTMGFKNMMGLIGRKRGKIHLGFDEKIVDINRVLKPDLVILDAVRILRRNGPSGGSLSYVEELNTILAGTDPVLVDAWGAQLFGYDPSYFGWIRLAHQAGLGSMDVNKNKPQIYSFKN